MPHPSFRSRHAVYIEAFRLEATFYLTLKPAGQPEIGTFSSFYAQKCCFSMKTFQEKKNVWSCALLIKKLKKVILTMFSKGK